MSHEQTPYSNKVKKMEKTGKIPPPGPAQQEDRYCPLPMLGAGMKEPSNIIGAREQNVTVVPCMGAKCMWYTQIAVPTGKGDEVQIVGQCAVFSIGQALFGIGNATGAAAAHLTKKE